MAAQIEELVVLEGAQGVVNPQWQPVVEVGEPGDSGRHGQRSRPGVLDGEELELAHGEYFRQGCPGIK